MHSLWLPGGLAPPCRVISHGHKSLYERHTASTEAYSVRMAVLLSAINSIRSLKETPFGRRTTKKLATMQLGPPRPNVSVQQVFYKGGEILHPGKESKSRSAEHT